MKYPLLVATLLLAACSSAPDAKTGGVAHEEASATVTLEHQDGRVLANRMRLFLMDRDVSIKSAGPTWDITGSEEEVDLARFLAAAFDTPSLTQEHRGLVKDFEKGGAKEALNAARGRADWGAHWLVGAFSDDRWLAMIPNSELSAFSEVVGTIQMSLSK